MSYASEYQSALQQISDENAGIQGLSYFVQTAARWHAVFDNVSANQVPEAQRASGQRVPLVVVLGHGIPEQLIYACGTVPFFLLGGSHASCQWSDSIMPRDADPASRSMLGYALQLAQRPDLELLFVVPTENDNMRKIAYSLKREGHAVLPIDIPPAAVSASAEQAWERSVHNLIKAVSRHVGKRATARSIRKADQLVAAARSAMMEFERTCIECNGAITSEAYLLVQHTYYQTRDIAQWTIKLQELSGEVRVRYRNIGRPSSRVPRILVIGSPVLFPQYKVPALIGDAGLHLLTTVDAASTSRFANLGPKEQRGSASRLISAIARKQYSYDSSSAHVVNQVMEQYVQHLLLTQEVNGIVCHILKGQIEYDFLLSRLEPLFERYDIPVFRLETDYQYQDVEQLRIRLEAFAEMLEQRTFVAVQANASRNCA